MSVDHISSAPTDPHELLSWRLSKVEDLKTANASKIADMVPRLTTLENWKDASESRLIRMEQKLDDGHRWLVGIMGALIVSLVLLAVNLVLGRIPGIHAR